MPNWHRNWGYLDIPAGMLVDIKADVPQDELVILSTGSQGEPNSALNRMARGAHRDVQVHAGDTIVISRRCHRRQRRKCWPDAQQPVPARLRTSFYGDLATVHVSGHGSREDMRIMLEAVHPRFLIPVHGETRHLHLHSYLAQQNGLDADAVFILENGAAWVSDGQRAWLEDPMPLKDVYVDGSLVGEIGDRVVQDRERLSQNGFVLCYVPVDRQRRLAGEVRLISQGFMPMDASKRLMEKAKRTLRRTLKKDGCRQQESICKTLQDFFYPSDALAPGHFAARRPGFDDNGGASLARIDDLIDTRPPTQGPPMKITPVVGE